MRVVYKDRDLELERRLREFVVRGDGALRESAAMAWFDIADGYPSEAARRWLTAEQILSVAYEQRLDLSVDLRERISSLIAQNSVYWYAEAAAVLGAWLENLEPAVQTRIFSEWMSAIASDSSWDEAAPRVLLLGHDAADQVRLVLESGLWKLLPDLPTETMLNALEGVFLFIEPGEAEKVATRTLRRCNAESVDLEALCDFLASSWPPYRLQALVIDVLGRKLRNGFTWLMERLRERAGHGGYGVRCAWALERLEDVARTSGRGYLLD